MKSISARAAATVAVAFGLSVIQPSDAIPPLSTPYHLLQGYVFQEIGAALQWDVAAGSWAADGRTYNVTTPAARSIANINVYFPPISGESPYQTLDDYVYGVRLMNPSPDAQTRVGFVYNFQDPANYYELVFSPTGMAQVRRVIAGTSSVVFEAAYKEGGPNKWLNAELYAHGTKMQLVVNGNSIVSGLQQRELPKGRLGLVAYGTSAKFDDVRIDMPTDKPQKETFNDGRAQQFTFDTNHWKIEEGVLKNFTVLQTNKVAFAQHAGWFAQTDSVRVRLRNPYGARGNLVGVFLEDGRREVVFSRTGFVRLDNVAKDGTVTTLASAAIPKLSSDWFEVVVRCDLTVDVFLNGAQVLTFEDGLKNRTGALGVVTHWSPGEFDLIDFNDAFLIEPYVQSFDASEPFEPIFPSGTWAATGGTYNSTAGGAADFSILFFSPTQPYAPRRGMDFFYRARVQLPSASAQSSIGFMTHWDFASGEHFEVLLTGAGQVIANKHVQGTVVRQATGTYAAAPNTWITLELRSISNRTSVFVNGSTKLHGVLQGQLRYGQAGLITHSTTGKFDDVVFAEIN
jgi:hypothetical protein